MKLTTSEARALTFAAEQDFRREQVPPGLDGARSIIQRLGFLQIDTISRVERAHHHILWTRISDYTPRLLHQLEAEPRSVFEYWSHAASYLPIEEARFCLPRMLHARTHDIGWHRRNDKLCQAVLDRIRTEGPLQAKDFEQSTGKRTGWWDWKPAKIALEHLFIEGRILVRGRTGFQKIYDVAERVLPQLNTLSVPTETEMADHLIDCALRRLGLASEQDIAYQRRFATKKIRPLLDERVRQQRLVACSVSGADRTYYTTPEMLEQTGRPKGRSRTETRKGQRAVLLSPFDPFLLNRKRTEEIFQFSYRLECYVPAAKRVYGYFCLPILWQDSFVALADAKVDRKSKVLTIEALHFLAIPKDAPTFLDDLAKELQLYSTFNGCREIRVEATHPTKHLRPLRSLL